MHPFTILIAAAIGLLIYSNVVFFTRPPSPTKHDLPVAMPEEAEGLRVKNLPFIIFGKPTVPRQAFAGRQDKLEQGKIHKIKAEPRSQRYIVFIKGPTELIVKIQLDNRFKTILKLLPGYSLFLPPTWKGQIEVPKDTVCMLYSSDSLGSLCLRLPELCAPIALKVAEAVQPFLAVCFSILEKLISQLQCWLEREAEPSGVLSKFASFLQLNQYSHSSRRKTKRFRSHLHFAHPPKEATKDQKMTPCHSLPTTTLSQGEK